MMRYLHTIRGEDILHALENIKTKQLSYCFLCANDLEESQLKKKVGDAWVVLPGRVSFERGYLSGGFYLKGSELLVLPMTEITHRYKIEESKAEEQLSVHSGGNF